MGTSKIIIGAILIFLGLIGLLFIFPIGLILILAGIVFIVFHKAESEIEGRKDLNKNKRLH